jgi:hypothetical protein
MLPSSIAILSTAIRPISLSRKNTDTGNLISLARLMLQENLPTGAFFAESVP